MAESTTEKNVSSAKSSAKKAIDKVPNDLGAGKASETVKEAALASLGVVGKLVDSVKVRAADAREETSGKWNEYIARGAQLKETASEKVNGGGFSFKFNLKDQRAQLRDLVDAVVAFAKPGKADLKTSKS